LLKGEKVDATLVGTFAASIIIFLVIDLAVRGSSIFWLRGNRIRRDRSRSLVIAAFAPIFALFPIITSINNGAIIIGFVVAVTLPVCAAVVLSRSAKGRSVVIVAIAAFFGAWMSVTLAIVAIASLYDWIHSNLEPRAEITAWRTECTPSLEELIQDTDPVKVRVGTFLSLRGPQTLPFWSDDMVLRKNDGRLITRLPAGQPFILKRDEFRSVMIDVNIERSKMGEFKDGKLSDCHVAFLVNPELPETAGSVGDNRGPD
jgi:hypothetical protein